MKQSINLKKQKGHKEVERILNNLHTEIFCNPSIKLLGDFPGNDLSKLKAAFTRLENQLYNSVIPE